MKVFSEMIHACLISNKYIKLKQIATFLRQEKKFKIIKVLYKQNAFKLV